MQMPALPNLPHTNPIQISGSASTKKAPILSIGARRASANATSRVMSNKQNETTSELQSPPENSAPTGGKTEQKKLSFGAKLSKMWNNADIPKPAILTNLKILQVFSKPSENNSQDLQPLKAKIRIEGEKIEVKIANKSNSLDNRVSDLTQKLSEGLKNYRNTAASPPKATSSSNQKVWQHTTASKQDLQNFSDLFEKDKGPLRKILEKGFAETKNDSKENADRMTFQLGKIMDDRLNIKMRGASVNKLALPTEINKNPNPEIKKLLLENGLTLSVQEQQALKLYSTSLFPLINSAVTNKDEFLISFMEKYNIPLENMAELKNMAMQINIVLASALNKLPPCETKLYRGDAMPLEQLKKFKVGDVLVDPKFLSFSQEEKTAIGFAKSSAKTKNKSEVIKANATSKNETETVKSSGNHVQVMYVVETGKKTGSKSLEEYSCTPSEKESMFTPPVAFKIKSVSDEKDKDGNYIIVLEEITLKRKK